MAIAIAFLNNLLEMMIDESCTPQECNSHNPFRIAIYLCDIASKKPEEKISGS
jgi:hypothetical protein